MAEGAVDRLLSMWSFHLWLHLDSSCLPFPITFVFPFDNVLFGRKTVNSPSCLSSHQQASCLGAYLGPPGIWWETVLGNPLVASPEEDHSRMVERTLEGRSASDLALPLGSTTSGACGPMLCGCSGTKGNGRNERAVRRLLLTGASADAELRRQN